MMTLISCVIIGLDTLYISLAIVLLAIIFILDEISQSMETTKKKERKQ